MLNEKRTYSSARAVFNASRTVTSTVALLLNLTFDILGTWSPFNLGATGTAVGLAMDWKAARDSNLRAGLNIILVSQMLGLREGGRGLETW